MSDTAATAETAPTDTTALADGAVERRRRGGRKVTRTADDLRSVVIGCRVDQATADEFAALAEASGTDRAGLLASLVAAELRRPTPKRHDRPTPLPDHKILSPLLRELQTGHAQMREGHGALVRLAGIVRAEGDQPALAHVNQTLDQHDRLTGQIETLIDRVTEAIMGGPPDA